MKNFVATQWLQDHLEDENIIVVDCRSDLLDISYGEKVYNDGHIKNAVFADLKKIMASPEKEHGGRTPLPTIEEFKERIEKLGINNDTLVVAYDELKISSAARFCWMLRCIGHSNNYVLDGGIDKWIKEERKLYTKKEENKDECINNNKDFKVSVNKEMRVDVNYVKEHMGKDIFLIDSRSNIRYRGLEEPIDKVAGHIPGAENYCWKDMLNEDGTVDEDKVKEIFSKLKDHNIVAYCGSGVDATFNYLLLDELGIKAKVYSGSWSDWITYKDNPIEHE
ncbi:sulfurtransferase [Clostridium sp. Marseille-Q2269]|uniref:sulfurtransferase n=1 Tax=Clostridium sp. Marseille-Q2269 TaxID=2942205 RepID=UPI002072AF18|nr:sulfurtransferase [Clostridium sp. Marseille-Q2269]